MAGGLAEYLPKNYILDYVNGTLTVSAASSSSDSSGGGGGGGGSSASTPTASTISATGGAVSVNITLSGTAATLELPTAKVTEIINKAQNNKAIFDLSKVSGVTRATLPTTALTQLAEAGLAAEFNLPQGSMTLSVNAAKSVAGKANGATVNMELNRLSVSDLNTAQRSTVKGSDVIVDLNITSGSQNITELGGNLTVTLPYTGPVPANVWYLNDAGELEQITSTFDSATKSITFVLNHLSVYLVRADEGASAQSAPRLAGNSRIDTAIAVSQQGWGSGADVVVLAYAYAFPDALAASPLAYKENAPILLTDSQTVTPTTLAEIQRLNPSKVILVGGTAVLSSDLENALRESYQVVRYAGVDCYETAVQIANAVGSTGTAVVVNGQIYQDALAISSYAANQGIPILFTQRDDLPAVTANALNSLGINNTIVAGGTGVVSDAVYGQLPNPTRYAGYDCYETAAAVANAPELNLNLTNVYVVTGLDFADALVAGNLAAKTMSPLLMTGPGTDLPAATENFFRTNQERIQGITVVGGAAIVPESQVNAIQNIVE